MKIYIKSFVSIFLNSMILGPKQLKQTKHYFIVYRLLGKRRKPKMHGPLVLLL